MNDYVKPYCTIKKEIPASAGMTGTPKKMSFPCIRESHKRKKNEQR